MTNKNRRALIDELYDTGSSLERVTNLLLEDEVKGRAFYTVKDEQMAYDANIGFMIWNGEIQGTLNNMINLLSKNKRVCLFLDNENKLLLLKKLKI